ncbi:MAG: monovalent cation/H+ antiporter complex subunit F [Spirochaetaceae bacterium]
MANIILMVACVILLLAMTITFIRLLIGPDYLNRVVAFDALTIMSISLIVFISHILGRSIYLDVALVYGLLSFLGVIAFARYTERGGLDD